MYTYMFLPLVIGLILAENITDFSGYHVYPGQGYNR